MNYNIITDFFTKFGWQLFLLALSGIVILGCLKWFGVFNKIKDKTWKKYVYFWLSCGFSIIACTIYLLATGCFQWGAYLVLCSSVIVLTIVVYNLYEHTHLRALWKIVLDAIAKLFKFILSSIVANTLSQEKLKNKAVALGSEALAELVKIAKENEEKAKQNVTKQ